jgi:hypothetical protein
MYWALQRKVRGYRQLSAFFCALWTVFNYDGGLSQKLTTTQTLDSVVGM